MKKYNIEEILNLIKTNKQKEYLQIVYYFLYPLAKKIKKEYAEKDEIQVDDIVQETVMKFYRYAHDGKIKNDENLEGYLFIMAKNIVLNHLTKRKIKTSEMNENFDFLDDNQEDMAQVEIRASALKQVMSLLSESCQTLINAVYYNNQSMKAVANTLGYSGEDVAKSKHYKCKQKLLELINMSPKLKNQMIMA